jgi:hypothetical protein
MKSKNILKIVTVIILHSALLVSAQKKKQKDIIQSQDIQEIEFFLATAHPEDPRREVLKKRLITLKNADWVKGRKTAKPMEARPLIVEETEIPDSVLTQKIEQTKIDETEEFKNLLKETGDEHKEKTINLLNTMFNEDVSSNQVILLLRNNSDCNMILRIKGEKSYDLAVPAHDENVMVLEKGRYELTSNVCDAKYNSVKDFAKSTMISIKNPVQIEIEKE